MRSYVNIGSSCPLAAKLGALRESVYEFYSDAEFTRRLNSALIWAEEFVADTGREMFVPAVGADQALHDRIVQCVRALMHRRAGVAELPSGTQVLRADLLEDLDWAAAAALLTQD